jgi:hypothetical protein
MRARPLAAGPGHPQQFACRRKTCDRTDKPYALRRLQYQPPPPNRNSSTTIKMTHSSVPMINPSPWSKINALRP